MEGTITLEYSKDGGTTWLGPYDAPYSASSSTIYCSLVYAWLDQEPSQDKAPESASDAELCWSGNARLHVLVKPRPLDHDSTDTEGKKLYKFLNALRCAPLIRLVAADINGYTEFAASNNTYYLVPGDCPPPEFHSSGEENAVFHINLLAKKKYAI